MKKNLRIVSAAAAALLAVAPVAAGVVPAASSVNTVQASAETEAQKGQVWNVVVKGDNTKLYTSDAVNNSVLAGATVAAGVKLQAKLVSVDNTETVTENNNAPANSVWQITTDGPYKNLFIKGGAIVAKTQVPTPAPTPTPEQTTAKYNLHSSFVKPAHIDGNWNNDQSEFVLNGNIPTKTNLDDVKEAVFAAADQSVKVSYRDASHYVSDITIKPNSAVFESIVRNSDNFDALKHLKGNDTLNRGAYTASLKVTYKLPANFANQLGITGTTTNENFTINGQKLNKDLTFTKTVKVQFAVANESDYNLYYVTSDNHNYANGQTVVATEKQNEYLFSRKDGKVSLAHLKSAIKNVFDNTKPALWNMTFGDTMPTSNRNLVGQIRHIFGNDAIKSEADNATFDPSNKSFTIKVTALNGQTVYVTFQNSYAEDTTSPVIVGNYYGNWQPVQVRKGYVNPIVITKQDSGVWQPTNYIRAWNNIKQPAYINASYEGNVDLTKPAIYNVTVKATNEANKTTSLVVPVIVSEINGKKMTTINNAVVYTKGNDGKMTKASLVNGDIQTGTLVHVYGEPVTVDGTQYYRIVSPDANYWVKASDLKDGVPATNNTDAQVITKTVNHIAAIYNKEGKQTNDKKLRAYNPVTVLDKTVTINGSKMYQIAENGKGVDKYVKASNIDGVSKTLTKNSYVYTAYGKKVYKTNGKAVKMPKRGHRSSLRKETKGKSVTVYGGALFNKQFYRIGHNQYIKVANFR